MARIIENTGTSMDEAIIIVDAIDHEDGIRAEYQYLTQKYGEEGKDWNLIIQALMERPVAERTSSSSQYFDCMLIDKGGKTVKVYFDIGSFFSKSRELGDHFRRRP